MQTDLIVQDSSFEVPGAHLKPRHLQVPAEDVREDVHGQPFGMPS